MAKGSSFNPVLGFLLLVVGLALGAAGGWAAAPFILGASTSAKDPRKAPAPVVRPAPKPVQATPAPAPAPTPSQGMSQVVESALVGARAKKAAQPLVVPADASLIPEQPDVREPEVTGVDVSFEPLARPFPLICPKVINRFERAEGKLVPVSPDPFCASLRGRFHAFFFWSTECGTACHDELTLLQGRVDDYERWTPPVRVGFVATDRFPSELAAFFQGQGAWTFASWQTPGESWLGEFGGSRAARALPYLIVTDPDRVVVYEGPAPTTPAALRDMEALLGGLGTSAPVPGAAKVDEKKAEPAAAASAPRKSTASVSKPKAEKATSKGSGGGAARVDYVSLGLQVMRLFPELAGTDALRSIVKAAERHINAKLARMSPAEARKQAANPSDALVREAVKAARKELGK